MAKRIRRMVKVRDGRLLEVWGTRKLLAHFASRIGRITLPGWLLTLELWDADKKQEDIFRIKVNYTYRHAQIWVGKEYWRCHYKEDALRHELVHVFLGPIEFYFDLNSHNVPLYKALLEQTVCDLTHALRKQS